MTLGHGKQYVLNTIKSMSESNSLSVLVTDTKKFPDLRRFKEGDKVSLSGVVAKVDSPKGSDYPYYIIKFNKLN